MSDRTSMLIIPQDEQLEVLVNTRPEHTDPDTLWKRAQSLLGGAMIERVRPINPFFPWENDDRWRLYVDEDGHAKRLKVNRRACRLYRGGYMIPFQPILGDAVLVSYDRDNDPENDYALTPLEAEFWKLWLDTRN